MDRGDQGDRPCHSSPLRRTPRPADIAGTGSESYSEDLQDAKWRVTRPYSKRENIRRQYPLE